MSSGVAAAVLSLREEGIARLVFDKLYASFEGVLINEAGEVFAIRGIPTMFKKNSAEPDNGTTSLPDDGTKLKNLLPICDLYIVDEETGTNYVLKKVKVAECINEEDPDLCSISLKSESVSFVSAEVLVGNRADKELREYLNPSLVGKNLCIYMGPMKINFHTAITPPTTPMAIPIPNGRQKRQSFTRSYTKESFEFELGTPREGDFFQ